jgi:hypothetical protein
MVQWYNGVTAGRFKKNHVFYFAPAPLSLCAIYK